MSRRQLIWLTFSKRCQTHKGVQSDSILDGNAGSCLRPPQMSSRSMLAAMVLAPSSSHPLAYGLLLAGGVGLVLPMGPAVLAAGALFGGVVAVAVVAVAQGWASRSIGISATSGAAAGLCGACSAVSAGAGCKRPVIHLCPYALWCCCD